MINIINRFNKKWLEEVNDILSDLDVKISSGIINGVNVFTVEPFNIDSMHENHIFIYAHGGAFVLGKGKAGLFEAILIADRLKIKVLSVDYRLAPKYKYPAAINDMLDVYSFVREESPELCITMGGTSAGGNIVITTIQQLLKENQQVPDIAYFGTPASDVSQNGVSLHTNKNVDENLMNYTKYGSLIRLYSGDIDLKDSRVSPIYGDFEGFPPSFLVTGTKDLLLSHTVRTHIKLRKANIPCDLLVYEGDSHGDYTQYHETENSYHMYGEMNNFINKYCRINIDDYFDVYVYGYPLVIMEISRRKFNMPMNTPFKIEITPDFTDIVKPNLDTHYTSAWLDLSEGPVIINIPKIDEYCMVPFLDAYTNVFETIGTRNYGPGPHTIFMVGRNWKGKVPKGTTFVRSPTNLAWMIARIEKNNNFREYNINIQSNNIKSQVIHKNIDTIPAKYVQNMSITEFFNELSLLLKDNPPLDQDIKIKRKLDKIGIIPGQNWIPPCSLPDINFIPEAIHNVWTSEVINPPPSVAQDKWTILSNGIGNYKTNYRLRAFVARVGLGANLPEDAVYPMTSVDSLGEKLHGKYDYVVRFSEEPPVKGFWSLTIYREDGSLIENVHKKYLLNNKDDLKYNQDGTLDIYVQNVQSATNWLPSPEDEFFTLVLRLYWPSDDILESEWSLPVIDKQ